MRRMAEENFMNNVTTMLENGQKEYRGHRKCLATEYRMAIYEGSIVRRLVFPFFPSSQWACRLLREGTNPLLQTKRGKLQQKRNAVNEQISKQIRIRAGAENLLRATSDKKLKEQITLELSFVDSNLNLLREQLTELNTSVQIYQNDKCPRSMPLIPFGLRETKDVELSVSFKDFITEHYAEDPAKYDQPLKSFAELRKAIKTPNRDDDGVKVLFEYYNHLCCVERRFFPSGRHPGIYFEWFDSLTGIPSMQRSVAFEKGSILFNIGALYTQLAANEDRSTAKGLEKAVEYFSRAAGVLHFLRENFSNSPSTDMKRDMLDAFLSLLLAQTQECFLDLCLFHLDNNKITSNGSLKLSEEAAQVSKLYTETWRSTTSQTIRSNFPTAWVALLTIKRDYYSALAHFFSAFSLLKNTTSTSAIRNSDDNDIRLQTVAERTLIGRAHLKCAHGLQEEAMNGVQMCKQLRHLTILQNVLKTNQERIKKLQQELGSTTLDEVESCHLYENVEITSQSVFDPTLIPPDFASFKVVDFFRDLGPVNVFCARNRWTMRVLHLRRTAKYPGYGFSVRGDAPVFISSVEPGGLASVNKLKVGDVIVSIDNRDTKWASHEEVVRQIRSPNDSLTLTIASPSNSSPTSSLHSLSNASTSTCSSASSSPASANVSNSYSTLPSNFHRSKHSLAPSTLISQQMKDNGLKNMKQKGKLQIPSNSADPAGSSWSLRNLLFTKRYSKSVELHLNNPSLFH